MARRRFRLNSLSRYTKESDRLVLDSYSAGCGGIVLRWRDPNEGMPIRFNLAATSMTELFLDGQPIKRATIMAPGEHVMAIRCYPYSEGHYFSGDSPRRAIAMTFTPHYPKAIIERLRFLVSAPALRGDTKRLRIPEILLRVKFLNGPQFHMTIRTGRQWKKPRR